MALRSPSLQIRERLQVIHVPTKRPVIGEDLRFGRRLPLMGGPRPSWRPAWTTEIASLFETRVPATVVLRSDCSVQTTFADALTTSTR